MLEGEIPETIMPVKTSKISHFCAFGFYERIKFRDNPVPFYWCNPVLGGYLVPIVDMIPALTSNILKYNGEFFNRFTYCMLTTYEVKIPTEKAL